MSNLTVFKNKMFGQIRTYTADDGEVVFFGKDVATALGYKNTNDALKQHCKGVVKRYPLKTGGGNQLARFITEPDLYRLITASKLPNAQRFEKWVFEEVLPTVRKHGGYLTPEKIEEVLLNPDTIIQLATNLKAEQEKRKQLEAQAEADRPKVVFADAVSASQSSILIGELAKYLKQNGVKLGQNQLFARLREEGYLRKDKGGWNLPTHRAESLGLFRVKETAITHSDGHVTISRTTKVTGKGQQFFINKYLPHH